VKCAIHDDDRDTAGKCSCSDIVRALRLSSADVEKLQWLRNELLNDWAHSVMWKHQTREVIVVLDGILAANSRGG
jgi:hypothetical protein